MIQKRKKRQSIDTIIDKKICCGCGSCTVICPTSAIEMHYGERFNFPVIDHQKCIRCGKCLTVCPSQFLLYGVKPAYKFALPSMLDNFYLAHAADSEIRHNSASGGFVTGLFTYLLNKKYIDGCIVSKCGSDNPLIARSFIATDRESLISAAGSKYAPVSSCAVLKNVINKPGKYAIIGTPCMLEGLSRLEKFIPVLKNSIVLKIGFVCAGMASRLSTKRFIENMGKIGIDKVRKICYRGLGWPGHFTVYGDNDITVMDRPLLGQGGSLQNLVGRDHYLRCENCLDHWSHFADIAVSDPWTEKMVQTEREGKTAVMVKTKKGMDLVKQAIGDGFLIAETISCEDMMNFNRHLVIDKNHSRHSWMYLYQLIFMHKPRYLIPIISMFIRRRLYGAKTTLRACLNDSYYY